MKRKTLVLAVSLALTVMTAGSAVAEKISIRADSWPPYNGDPKSDKPGYMIELAETIFASKGQEIDYKLMPWTRSLNEVQKGNYDAVVGTDSEESPDFIFPQEPFGVLQNGFFVKKGSNWSYSGLDSLQQIRLGVIDSYSYDTEIDDYIEKNKGTRKIHVSKGDDALPRMLKMLNAGRLDVVVDNIFVVQQTLQQTNLSNEIVRATLLGEQSPLYIAFSPKKKNSREYARIIDEGMAELRSSGKLQEILSRYAVNDWK